jgi:gliding motility-associated-like protein
MGGNARDQMVSIYELADYNILAGGTTKSSANGEVTETNNGGYDFWVAYIDSSNLSAIWDKTYGGDKDEMLAKVKWLDDGSYILAGSSKSGKSGDKTQNAQGGWDYWIVKISDDGTKIWDKTFGGSKDDFLYSIDISIDDGYILGGYSTSAKSGDKTEDSRGGTDYWIVVIDADGNFKWDKTIGGSSEDTLYAIVTDSYEEKYLLAGTSSSSASGDKTSANIGSSDYWVILLDTNGTIVADQTYGGTETDVLTSAALGLKNSGYLLAGYSNSDSSGSKTQDSKGGYDYWIVCTDSMGQMLWDKSIGGMSNDIATTIYFSLEGRHMIGGYSISDASGDKSAGMKGGYDYWIVKIDSVGHISYDYTFGGSDNDYLYCMSQSCNRGYYLGGESTSDIGEDKTEINRGISDYWLVKVNAPTIPLFSFVVSCEGEVSLFYDRSETFPDYWYWEFGDPSSGADNSSYGKNANHIYDEPGIYSVTLRVQEGCQKDTTITIEIEVPENRLRDVISLGADTVLCEGDAIILSVPYDSTFSYLWNTGETTRTIIVNTPGIYAITATDGVCSNYDDVEIGYCPRLYTPNIFSPDGDGNNDSFKVYGTGITEMELTIYDRWGQIIFETTDINEGWNGTLHGNQLPIDTYVYRVYYKGIGSKEYKKIGHISLVR